MFFPIQPDSETETKTFIADADVRLGQIVSCDLERGHVVPMEADDHPERRAIAGIALADAKQGEAVLVVVKFKTEVNPSDDLPFYMHPDILDGKDE